MCNSRWARPASSWCRPMPTWISPTATTGPARHHRFGPISRHQDPRHQDHQASAALQLEIIALRHQLGVLQRSVKRPKLNHFDQFLWAWFNRRAQTDQIRLWDLLLSRIRRTASKRSFLIRSADSTVPIGSYFFMVRFRRSISPEIAKSSSLRLARPSSRWFHHSPYHCSSDAPALRRLILRFLNVISRGMFGNKSNWSSPSTACGLLFTSALINTSAPCTANCDCIAFQSFPSASMTWSRIFPAVVSPSFSKRCVWALLARSRNLFSLSPSCGVFTSSSYKVARRPDVGGLPAIPAQHTGSAPARIDHSSIVSSEKASEGGMGRKKRLPLRSEPCLRTPLRAGSSTRKETTWPATLAPTDTPVFGN